MKKSIIILLNTLCGGILGVIICAMYNHEITLMAADRNMYAAAELFARATVFGILGSVFGTAVALYAYAREEA